MLFIVADLFWRKAIHHTFSIRFKWNFHLKWKCLKWIPFEFNIFHAIWLYSPKSAMTPCQTLKLYEWVLILRRFTNHLKPHTWIRIHWISFYGFAAKHKAGSFFVLPHREHSCPTMRKGSLNPRPSGKEVFQFITGKFPFSEKSIRHGWMENFLPFRISPKNCIELNNS